MDHHIPNGVKRDILVMVDEDGQRTLFRLVEVGDPREVVRLACDPNLPVVMIDAAVPSTGRLEAPAETDQGPRRSTLIVLNLHRTDDADAGGFVAYKGPRRGR